MKIQSKILSYLLIALLSLSAFLGTSLNFANAQLTPYSFSGFIDVNKAVWHNIFNVKQNELLLISISGDVGFNSILFDPDQKQLGYVTNNGMHVYRYNATESGTYLLQLSSAFARNTTYSGSSSHEINTAKQMTPYDFSGFIDVNKAVWHSIFNVKQNDLLLISISGDVGFNSILIDPDQNQVGYVTNNGMHVYRYNATKTGTYLLQLSSAFARNTTYSGSSSHEISNGSGPTTTPPPSEIPSITPGPTSIPSFIANKSVILDASILFGVNTANAIYTWNFGDGTQPENTSEGKVSHVFQLAGTFNVALTVTEVGSGRVQNFNTPVIVTPEVIVNIEQPSSWQPIATVIGAVITAGVAATVALWVHHKQQRDRDAENTKKVSKIITDKKEP